MAVCPPIQLPKQCLIQIKSGTLLAAIAKIVVFAIVCGAGTAPVLATETGPIDDLPNYFAGVEAWSYPSGLLVYFLNMPKSDKIYFRATLPVGSRQDPEGLEGLAHFVEHMMFTGPAGMSKAEFKRRVEQHGGSTNASTSRAWTDYKLKLPANEWRFGLEWFEELMFGHRFVDEHVLEERRAVILERDLEQATPIDYLKRWFVYPDWSKPPGFWERELGIPTEHNSNIGTWESLQSVTREDLQAFHDRWYGPQNMTVAIFGRLDRDAVKAIVDARFGSQERFGEVARVRVPATPASRYRRSVRFQQRGGHGYSLTYVIPNMTPDDWAWGLFLRDLTSEHLNDVLRHERRAAYGVRSSFRTYRGHATLKVGGNFDPEQERDSRAYIEQFVDDLKHDDVDPELFEALRDRVTSSLLLKNQSTSELAQWVRNDFYQRDVHGDRFPDVVAFVRQVSSAGLAAWMSERLTEERRIVVLRRPAPLWPLMVIVLQILVVLVTFRLCRRFLIRPLDLKRLSYHRKFHYGLVPLLVGVTLLTVVVATGGNLLNLAAVRLEQALVEPWDVYAIHLGWRLAAVSFLTVLMLIVPASIPRKILLLDDHWRIKYVSYRTRMLNYGEIRQLQRRHVVQALCDWRAWPCRVLHWGLFRRGVHLRVGHGSWFFKTRDDAELLEQLELRREARSSGSLSG